MGTIYCIPRHCMQLARIGYISYQAIHDPDCIIRTIHICVQFKLLSSISDDRLLGAEFYEGRFGWATMSRCQIVRSSRTRLCVRSVFSVVFMMSNGPQIDPTVERIGPNGTERLRYWCAAVFHVPPLLQWRMIGAAKTAGAAEGGVLQRGESPLIQRCHYDHLPLRSISHTVQI